MFAIGRTTRFAVFPAFQIGRLSVVHFPESKFKLSFHAPRGVDMKGGARDLYALNIGRFMLLYEARTGMSPCDTHTAIPFRTAQPQPEHGG